MPQLKPMVKLVKMQNKGYLTYYENLQLIYNSYEIPMAEIFLFM